MLSLLDRLGLVALGMIIAVLAVPLGLALILCSFLAGSALFAGRSDAL